MDTALSLHVDTGYSLSLSLHVDTASLYTWTQPLSTRRHSLYLTTRGHSLSLRADIASLYAWTQLLPTYGHSLSLRGLSLRVDTASLSLRAPCG